MHLAGLLPGLLNAAAGPPMREYLHANFQITSSFGELKMYVWEIIKIELCHILPIFELILQIYYAHNTT
jgi:hypothetical protein